MWSPLKDIRAVSGHFIYDLLSVFVVSRLEGHGSLTFEQLLPWLVSGVAFGTYLKPCTVTGPSGSVFLEAWREGGPRGG